MKKVCLFCAITLCILLFFQGYWIHNVYKEDQSRRLKLIENLFDKAIDQEMWIRLVGRPTNPHNPRLIVKHAKEMTPKEKSSYKGDTIYLKKASRSGVGESLSEIYFQSFQDVLSETRPLQLATLDSIFRNQLITTGLVTTDCQIRVYNRAQQLISSTSPAFQKYFNTLITPARSIGTQGAMSVQAYVNVPLKTIVKNMLFAFITSLLIIIIVFGCLAYQLKMIRRSRQALQERETAVYGAIHDLKAPLNAVFALLDLIAMDIHDKQLQSFLEKGKNQIRRLSETIESMLDTMKKQEGKELRPVYPISPEEWTEQLRKGLDVLYPTKQYTFQMVNRLSEPVLYTDPVRLERCLFNLMENALKYSDDGVRLTLTFSEDNDRIGIALQDTGWGIPKKAQKNLGKQFYRVKQAGKSLQPGYGIGLSSVKQLVKEMNGDFSFESTEGTGSIFRIRIPKQEATDKDRESSGH